MDSIPQFVARKFGREPVVYHTPLLEDILGVTYGCIVYQEQVMQIFQRLAGVRKIIVRGFQLGFILVLFPGDIRAVERHQAVQLILGGIFKDGLHFFSLHGFSFLRYAFYGVASRARCLLRPQPGEFVYNKGSRLVDSCP